MAALAGLLAISKSKIETRLKKLYFVLHILKDLHSSVRLFYVLFRDFLLHAETRKTPFWVDKKEMH